MFFKVARILSGFEMKIQQSLIFLYSSWSTAFSQSNNLSIYPVGLLFIRERTHMYDGMDVLDNPDDLFPVKVEDATQTIEKLSACQG